MKYYLAIDIGASSGRHILGSVQNGKLCLEEIYRFENNLSQGTDGLVWDIDHLVNEVKSGIKQCAALGKIPTTVAIDTWGVDYVLLDNNEKIIEPVFAYRNDRTLKSIPLVEEIISFEALYAKTGIQKLNYNTIYQLYCDKLAGRLERAQYFMMIPDYLSYCLTGVVNNEYTNATTTAMVNAITKTWDGEVIEKLGYPRHLFGKLSLPGYEIGMFSDEMAEYAGFSAKVISCPSHDTASAVAGTPLLDNSLYVSSGTWSLIGAENTEAILGDVARKANFANEGGIEYRFRFLKNYIGMWFFQNIRRNLNKKYSYDEMMKMAMDCGEYTYIDVMADEFMAPENMVEAIKKYLSKPDMPLDKLLNTVYHSLAKSYNNAVEEIEGIIGKKIDNIFIVGGGSADTYLNALTAKYTGKKVFAGPKEATATGNLISQLMADNGITLSKARDIVGKTFNVEEVNL